LDLEVVTQSEIGVHDIDSRFELHDEGVREMEIAEQAQTKPQRSLILIWTSIAD
jgi:hypothetical protein